MPHDYVPRMINLERSDYEIVRQMGITVVIASHDPKVEEAADWVYELRDGLLVKSVQRA